MKRTGGGPARRRKPGPPQQRRARGLGGEQVEGRQAVRELLLAGTRRAHEVLLASDLDKAPIIEDIRQLAAERKVPVREVSRSRLEAVARTAAPQGVLAKAAPLPERDLDSVLAGRKGSKPLLVALDGVADPGNLGAVLRSAAGAGVDALILARHRSVHVTPTVAKAAAGAVEHVPIVIVPGLPSALVALQRQGVWIVGLDSTAPRTIWDLTVAAEAVCLVLGAEGSGLSRLVRQRCEELVSIPLQGPMASLNVAVASAIAMFEVQRQRWSESRAE